MDDSKKRQQETFQELNHLDVIEIPLKKTYLRDLFRKCWDNLFSNPRITGLHFFVGDPNE